ncbi:unnamed protein product, partial [Polarella glacialis]
SASGLVKVWSLEIGVCERTLAGHDGCVCSLACPSRADILESFETSGLAASGGWDGTARLWDIHSGASRGVLLGHEDRVRCVDLSADGRTAATASDDRTAKLWRLQ